MVLQGVAAEKEKAEESAKKAKAEAAKAIDGILYLCASCLVNCNNKFDGGFEPMLFVEAATYVAARWRE